MRQFYKRHPLLSQRNAETVDHRRIYIASRHAIEDYFVSFKKFSLTQKCVVGRMSASHAYVRKPTNDVDVGCMRERWCLEVPDHPGKISSNAL